MVNTNDDWTDGLYDGEPYVSGEQPKSSKLIKLNSNENPYPPAPQVAEAIRSFDSSTLRYYSNSNGSPLKEALAEYHGVNPNQVFVGNGSDEVLALSFRACFGTGKPILFPDITYSFYPVWCSFLGIPYKTIPIKDDFSINADDYSENNGGVVIANPNAPTSIGEGYDFIKNILDSNSKSIVIVDEAYADFAEFSAESLLNDYPNLLVVRTFSKSKSLAGLRIGYALGSEKVVSALIAAKDSFNSYPIDSVAITAGVAALAAKDYYKGITDKIIAAREYAAKAFTEMGFNVIPSATNFLFVGFDTKGNAKAMFDFLRSNDILVRYFDKPGINQYLRISVGTMDEMQQLVKVASECSTIRK